MLYLVRTLLHFCQIRGLAWEPRKDIHFLCQHYGDQLQSIRSLLNPDFIERKFLRTAFVSRLPFEEQRRCYRTLTGREPPSATTLAPPTAEGNHIRSRSASELPRVQGISRASLPDFLCPPESQKIKTSHPRAEHATSTLMEHTGPSSNAAAYTRDSRSRYRMSSAPSSRRTSPTDPQSGSNPQMQFSNLKPSSEPAPSLSLHERAASYSTPNAHPGVPGPCVAQVPAKNTSSARSPLLDIRTTHRIPEKSSPEGFGTSVPEQRLSRLQVVNSAGETISRTRYDAEAKEEAYNLHVVGPQGVYQAPQNHPSPPPTASEATTLSQNSPPIFELDATPPPHDILAELSADIDAALQVSHHPRTSPQPALPQSHDSYRPPVPRTQSASLSTLPASLMVGNASPQLPSTPPHNTPSTYPTTQTNASRYSRQYPPPSFAQAPNSLPASPPLTPAPLSVYKAYQPTTIPNSGQVYPVSPPDSAGTEHRIRPTSFMQVKDIDGMGHYFATHNRQASHHVQEVIQSLDSSMLAMEYQAALPQFDEGYGRR
jgi:hypothetical protein